MNHESWREGAIRRFRFELIAIAILFVLTEIAGLLRIVPHLEAVSLRALVTNPLFAIGFGSPLVLYLSSLPPPRHIAVLFVVGTMCALLLRVVFGPPNAMQWVIGLGIGSTVVMIWRTFRGDANERREVLLFLLPAAVTLFFTLEAAMFLGFVSNYSARTFDALAYVTDASFGFPISFAVGQLFADRPAIGTICTLIYLAPPPGLIFVYALQAKSRNHPPVDIVTALLAMGAIGYALYFVFPVSGPKFAFATFPEAAPAASSLAGKLIEVAPAPRNAIPSLHMASALIALGHAWRYGRVARIAALIFAIGTFLGTMGTGEHYFIDLVVAVPFTIAMQAVLLPRGSISPRRRLAVAGLSIAVFGTWLFAIRFHDATLLEVAALPWLLLGVTLLVAATGLKFLTSLHPHRQAAPEMN